MNTYFNIPILLYHNILDYGCDITAVSVSQFESHLQLLKRLGYFTCSLAEALRAFQQGHRIEKTVLIQFDDAYVDTLEVAAPILRHYGFIASVFVIADYIGKPNTWDHRIDRKLLHMNYTDISKWLSYGFEIGCHTKCHHNLIKFSNDELRVELKESKLFLENQFSQSVNFLSYPYGAYNDAVKSMAAQEYSLAFSVGDGKDNWAQDPFAIKRFQINRKYNNNDITMFISSGVVQ